MLCRACDVFRSSEAAAVALEEMRFDARHVQLGLDAPQAHRRMTGGAGPAQHPEGGRTVGPARNSMGHGRTHVSCWGGKKLAVLTPQRVSPTWRARGIAPRCRLHFFVVSARVRDLLLRAKHLFVAAMVCLGCGSDSAQQGRSELVASHVRKVPAAWQGSFCALRASAAFVHPKPRSLIDLSSAQPGANKQVFGSR